MSREVVSNISANLPYSLVKTSFIVSQLWKILEHFFINTYLLKIIAMRSQGHFTDLENRTHSASLTDGACKTLVHSLVTSRHDDGNALLYKINSNYIIKMQIVQHTAARLITRHSNVNIFSLCCLICIGFMWCIESV